MTEESRMGEIELSESKKLEGNELYMQSKFREAVECYTQAIDICPTNAVYYANRAAAYIMLRKYKDGLQDAQKSTRLDPSFLKGYTREGRCHKMLGNSMAAASCFNHVLEIDAVHGEALRELKSIKHLQETEAKIDLHFIREDYRSALFCLEKCLEQSPASQSFKVRKAEVLVLLGRTKEGQETANDVIVREELHPEALYVRGLSLFYMNSLDRALAQFQQVLRLVPEHTKAREAMKGVKQMMEHQEAGNRAFREERLREAYDAYTKALAIDPKNRGCNTKLYCYRATVAMKLKLLEAAVSDATKAIKLDDKCINAYVKRGKCYMDLTNFEEAVRDYETAYKLSRSRDHKQLLREAKAALKQSLKKDYYKILGVERTATDEEIKKAYKKRALLHHPDRHAHATKEQQKKEEVKFKELGEAYSVLSDSAQKSQYDRCLDMEDMHNFSFNNVDPEQIFRAFFGNMNMHQFYPHGGPPPGASGSYPGSNFNFQFG